MNEDDRIPETIADPIIEAFRVLAQATVDSDKSLLTLVQEVIERLSELEDKVNLLIITQNIKSKQ